MVGLVFLAVAAAYGFAGGVLGFPLTSLCSLLPFVILGIGIDDMLVIVFQMRAIDRQVGSAAYRIQLAVERCALSITFTTATDCLAFSIGSTSTIPSISWFCVYAGFAIAMVYILSLTLGVAVLYLDTVRKERRG